MQFSVRCPLPCLPGEVEEGLTHSGGTGKASLRGVGEIKAACPGALRWKVMCKRNLKERRTVMVWGWRGSLCVSCP